MEGRERAKSILIPLAHNSAVFLAAFSPQTLTTHIIVQSARVVFIMLPLQAFSNNASPSGRQKKTGRCPSMWCRKCHERSRIVRLMLEPLAMWRVMCMHLAVMLQESLHVIKADTSVPSALLCVLLQRTVLLYADIAVLAGIYPVFLAGRWLDGPHLCCMQTRAVARAASWNINTQSKETEKELQLNAISHDGRAARQNYD